MAETKLALAATLFLALMLVVGAVLTDTSDSPANAAGDTVTVEQPKP
jgi:hypothetical protein